MDGRCRWLELLGRGMADCSSDECFSLLLFTHLPNFLALIPRTITFSKEWKTVSETNGTYLLYPKAKCFLDKKRQY